jgi:hypothetical protein
LEALVSFWLALAVVAIFVLLLAAMPWKRPHPNHVLALEMLELLADKGPESVSESRDVSGLGERVSTGNNKHDHQAV